jgi:hypothetical protein
MNKIKMSEKVINKLLHNINPKNATCPDDPCDKLLKEMKDHLSPIITLVFQNSINTYKIPTDWRHLRCFQKRRQTQSNYLQTFSLTCILCEIAIQIMEHLGKKNPNILYDLQHGFQSKTSCETQLISFIQDLTKDNTNNIQTDVIVMDVHKAFNKVLHKQLLYKLKHYGIGIHPGMNW